MKKNSQKLIDKNKLLNKKVTEIKNEFLLSQSRMKREIEIYENYLKNSLTENSLKPSLMRIKKQRSKQIFLENLMQNTDAQIKLFEKELNPN